MFISLQLHGGSTVFKREPNVHLQTDRKLKYYYTLCDREGGSDVSSGPVHGHPGELSSAQDEGSFKGTAPCLVTQK